MDVDGSFYEQISEVACAGCFWDDSGDWLLGFGRKLGLCTSLQVELWGIGTALNLAWERRCPKLILETDSVEAINLIINDCPSLRYAVDMIQGIRSRLQEP